MEQLTYLTATNQKDDAGCPLLRLPPEIRNRIYHFAREDPAWGIYKFAPRVKSQIYNHSHYRHNRPWRFFGLTRVCQKLRSEYRSIWLKDLSIRIKPKDVENFVAGFLHGRKELAPSIIEVLYDEREHKYEKKYYLLPLLQLKISSPQTTFDIVPRYFVDSLRDANVDYCKRCLDTYYTDGIAAVGHDTQHKDCSNDNHTAILNGYTVAYYYYLIRQRTISTRVIAKFLSLSNEIWQNALRANYFTSVRFASGKHKSKDSNYIRIKLECDAQLWSQVNSLENAREMLKLWEVPCLQQTRSIRYILCYAEDTRVTMEGGKTHSHYTREQKYII